MTKKTIPWWRLHKIAEELQGNLKSVKVVESNGKSYSKIVIEYQEEEDD